MGMLFLILSLVALKVAAWQMGLFSGIFGTTQTPDFTIAGLSFTAAIIFFGLWLAGRIHKEETRSNMLLE